MPRRQQKRNDDVYQAWKEGRISLTVDQLEFIIFSVNNTTDFNFYSGPFEADYEDFKNFVCT
jgi:hypothetical protein